MGLIKAIIGIGLIGLGVVLLVKAIANLLLHWAGEGTPSPAEPKPVTTVVLADQTEEWARYIPPIRED